MQTTPLNGGVSRAMPIGNAGVGPKFNLSNLFNQRIGGGGGPMGGLGGIFRTMAAMNSGGGGNSASMSSAKDAIEYELSHAKSMAAQAVAYSDDARSASERSAKQSAASESRYYANEARAAADRAQSRVSEYPDGQGMASAAMAEADRAYSAAQYAADAASGW